MFPNFTSITQREQKRHELLEKAQRRVRQANAKRQMYEGASWATDADKTISLTSTSAQTDSTTGSSEPLKKTVSDESFQTNPEVSTNSEVNVHPVMVDAEVHVRPDTTDRELQARPDTTDRNVQARPMTSDVGVDNSARMVHAETNSNLSMKDGEIRVISKRSTDANNLDTEEQVSSREWIIGFFKKNLNWVALRIQPIRKKTGREDPRYVLGENGALITVRTGQNFKTYGSLDWVATESKIRDIWYEGESQSIDEVGAMRDEENLTRTAMRLEKKKRAGDELEELDVILKDRRLPDIRFSHKSTSTTSNNADSKIKLFWNIQK